MEKKINLYLLSGFLGSGKTTFLTNVLKDLPDEKVGVIMNEFGRIGIDGTIISKPGMKLVEINRGSIFCSCLKLSFASAMVEMAEHPIKYLFVESSGLADPSNIGEILQGVESVKGDVYNYKGSICLVDGLYFLDQLEHLETVEKQLKHCHLAIISKIDLISKETLEKVKSKIHEINSNVIIKEAHFGKLNYDFLKDDLMKNEIIANEETSNTIENKPKTMGLSFKGKLKKEELKRFLDGVSPYCYRIKGFFNLEDGWNQVDVVNNKIDYKVVNDEYQESTLVFISKIGPNIIRKVNDSWHEVIGQEMKLSN